MPQHFAYSAASGDTVQDRVQAIRILIDSSFAVHFAISVHLLDVIGCIVEFQIEACHLNYRMKLSGQDLIIDKITQSVVDGDYSN